MHASAKSFFLVWLLETLRKVIRDRDPSFFCLRELNHWSTSNPLAPATIIRSPCLLFVLSCIHTGTHWAAFAPPMQSVHCQYMILAYFCIFLGVVHYCCFAFCLRLLVSLEREPYVLRLSTTSKYRISCKSQEPDESCSLRKTCSYQAHVSKIERESSNANLMVGAGKR